MKLKEITKMLREDEFVVQWGEKVKKPTRLLTRFVKTSAGQAASASYRAVPAESYAGKPRPLYIAIRKTATDGQGTFVLRAYRKIGDDDYEEMNVKDMRAKIIEYLAPKVNVKTILTDVLEKTDPEDLVELFNRVQTEPKVTSGRQRGSCSFLYVRGKQGTPFVLQLTE